MAAATQYYLEQMLPELDDFQRRGPEIKQIVKQRTILETAIHKTAPTKTAYLDYILFESNLELLRRKRKARFALLPTNDTKADNGVTLSDFSLLKRIHSLYQKALKKYHGDVELWIQYFTWAVQVGSTRTLGLMFAKAILLHPTNVTFFVLSASWEFEHLGNVDSSRAIFQSGLRLNSKSSQLWTEYYKLELLSLEKIRQRNLILSTGKLTKEEIEEKAEKLVDCYKNIPEIVFRNACESVEGVAFRMGVLRISRSFTELFNGDFSFIVQSIEKDFKNNIHNRNALAQSFFEGVTSDSTDAELLDAFEGCVNAYERAVADNTTAEMLGLFILFFEELESKYEAIFLKELIQSVLVDARKMLADLS